MDTEYLCVTVLGRPGEAETEFKSRLTAFWSHYLRARPDDYEKVYAEATRFEMEGDRPARQYLVESDGVVALCAELTAAGLGHVPVDEHDVYTKYEAGGSDWFQIEH